MEQFLELLTTNWQFLVSNLQILLPMIVLYSVVLSAFIMWLVNQQLASKTGQITLYKETIGDLEKRIDMLSDGETGANLTRDIVAEIESRYELEPKLLLPEHSRENMVGILNRSPSGAVGLLVDLGAPAANRVPFQIADMLEACDWDCHKFYFEPREWIAGKYGLKVLSFSKPAVSEQTQTILDVLRAAGIPHEHHRFSAEETPYGIRRGAVRADCVLLFHAPDEPPRIFDWPVMTAEATGDGA